MSALLCLWWTIGPMAFLKSPIRRSLAVHGVLLSAAVPLVKV